MSAISAVSASIDSVNQILQMAQEKNIGQAQKLMKMTVEQSLASEPGKGENIDISA